MPTQEERLQTVEFDLKQFKTETVKVYGDMAFEMTIIKGLTENAIGITQELRQDISEIGKRLDQTDTRLDRIETLLTQILARLPKAP